MVNTTREVDGKFRLPCNSINARLARLSHYHKLYEIRVTTRNGEIPVGLFYSCRLPKKRQESEAIPIAVENPTGINAGITVGLGITDGNDKTNRNHHPKS